MTKHLTSLGAGAILLTALASGPAQAACYGSSCLCPIVPAPFPAVHARTIGATVHFDFDGTQLDGADQATLDRFARGYKLSGGDRPVGVTGHTDSIGSRSYNQRLSEHRAATVKQYLASRGVDERYISTAGLGESQPVASNRTAVGRAQNRRAEVSASRRQVMLR